MEHRDGVGIPANVLIEVHDAKTGALLRSEERHNLFVLTGRNLIRDALNGTSGTFTISHLGVGTGTTAAASTDTTLGSQVQRDAVTKRTAGSGSLTIQYYLASSAANGSTLTEAGLFNASSGGTMFARVVHTAIAKTASITVTYTWTITISAS